MFFAAQNVLLHSDFASIFVIAP